MRIAILGAGHIGGACVKGFVKAGETDLVLTAKSEETLSKFDSSIDTTLDNKTAVEGADIIVIAVKTPSFAEVAEQIRGILLPNQIVACMAAQVTPEELTASLENGDGVLPKIAYVIPNTAAEVGESMTFISDVSAGADGLKTLADLFSKIGLTSVVGRELLSPAISLASCGMGYAIKYISAAVQAGLAVGLESDDAVRTVIQTVKGSAILLSAHGGFPERELRKVATPGGLTEKGVMAMDEAGFNEAVVKGVKASLK